MNRVRLLTVIVSLSVTVSTYRGAESKNSSQTLIATNEGHIQRPEKFRGAKASISIAAPVETVWRAIHEERDHDPDVVSTTVVSEQSSVVILEQKYRNIPIYGTVVCRTRNEEIPYKRIDYSLEYSNHFKAMEGSWTLTPMKSGCATQLELSSFLDAGVSVPRMFYAPFAPGRLLKRLRLVKALAEKEQALTTPIH